MGHANMMMFPIENRIEMICSDNDYSAKIVKSLPDRTKCLQCLIIFYACPVRLSIVTSMHLKSIPFYPMMD